MKSTFRLLMIIALVLGVFAQYTPASAAEMYKWKGTGGEAYFSSWDESGCVVTDVSVFTRDESFQNPPGRPSTGSFVSLYIFQYDYCSGVWLRDAFGSAWLGENDLQVKKNLAWATLTTTVNVYDWISGTSFDVYVDLSWTASGSATRQTSSFRSHTPECKFHSRFQGSFRSAEVNGTVSDGFTNFTPWSGWGSLFDARGTDSFIGCF